ncbi:baculoviral IAP repeat-containing protein 7-like [Watersipora subatra]|uniref:baculoviral IAP repeat-containing protein 7-like n=1 Tax=Watersipora subatra TaxID=2589382 RepID=UPI00355B4B95
MGDVLISNANYASERHRLKTFANSGRDSDIPAVRYASAGFALAAIDGSQIHHCHFCHLEVKNLHATHDPLAWHRVYSKSCPFLKNHSQTNRQDVGIPFPDNSLSAVEFGPVILRAPQNESQIDESEAQLFSNEPHSDQHITLVMVAEESTDAEEVPTSSEELNKLYRAQSQLRSILPKQSIEVIRKPSPNIDQILSTFNYETHRRKTFNAWPKSTIVSPRELAASGFIYIHGTDDTVECFYCKLRISDWTNRMVPDVVHRKKSMHCQFMQGMKTVRNIPDVLADIFNDDALPLPSTETELGVVTESMKHPEFAVDSRRKDTFLTWPSGNSKLASEMIEHQLFYTGRGDVVCCFSCGVEMSDWAPTDDVWRRHARQSPECQLVIQEKGADWVAATIQEHGRYVEPEKEPVIHVVTTRMLLPRMDNTATQNVLQMISPDYPREEVRSALIRNIKRFESKGCT